MLKHCVVTMDPEEKIDYLSTMNDDCILEVIDVQWCDIDEARFQYGVEMSNPFLEIDYAKKNVKLINDKKYIAFEAFLYSIFLLKI